MRLCRTCGVTKPIDDFALCRRDKTYGRQTKCKQCKRDYYLVNLEAEKARGLKHYRENKEKYRSSSKNYYNTNKEVILLKAKEKYQTDRETKANKNKDYRVKNNGEIKKYNKRWRVLNKDKVNANSKKYKTRKIKACPDWLTDLQKEQIEQFYWLAKDLKAVTGDEYQVDHIVPLKGRNVCGLHVPWNLQILPRDMNIIKGNRFEDSSI